VSHFGPLELAAAIAIGLALGQLLRMLFPRHP
jgi:hypothetical protein